MKGGLFPFKFETKKNSLKLGIVHIHFKSSRKSTTMGNQDDIKGMKKESDGGGGEKKRK